MSNLVFPSLPGLDIAVERTEEYPATTIHRTVSAKEYRTTWGSNPIYHYKLTFNALRANVAAPSPYQGFNEETVLTSFLDTHYGAWDSFLFNDPVDGVQRRVRFDKDSLAITKIVDQMWQGTVALTSVL